MSLDQYFEKAIWYFPIFEYNALQNNPGLFVVTGFFFSCNEAI